VCRILQINDIQPFIRKAYTGEQYLCSLIDQFDATRDMTESIVEEPTALADGSLFLIRASGRWETNPCSWKCLLRKRPPSGMQEATLRNGWSHSDEKLRSRD